MTSSNSFPYLPFLLTLLALLLLPAAASAAEGPHLFGGLLHAPVGGAVLVPVADRLAVTGLHAWGADGVSVDAGGVDGLGIRLETDLDDPDAVLFAQARSEADGTITDLATLQIRRSGTCLALQPDFPAFGSPTYDLLGFRDGEVVVHRPGLLGPLGNAQTAGAELRLELYDGAVGLAGLDPSAGLALAVDGSTWAVDRILLTAEAPIPGTQISGVRLTGEGLPALELLEHHLWIDALPYRFEGDGVLLPEADGLRILSGGATAGVILDLWEAEAWSTAVTDRVPTAGPEAPTLEILSYGPGGSEEGTEAAAGRTTDVPDSGSTVLAPAFDAASDITVVVQDSVGTVASGSFPAGEVARFPTDDFFVETFLFSPVEPGIAYSFGDPVPVTLNGESPVLGDSIFAFPSLSFTRGAVPVDFLSQALVLGSGFQEFRLRNVNVHLQQQPSGRLPGDIDMEATACRKDPDGTVHYCVLFENLKESPTSFLVDTLREPALKNRQHEPRTMLSQLFHLEGRQKCRVGLTGYPGKRFGPLKFCLSARDGLGPQTVCLQTTLRHGRATEFSPCPEDPTDGIRLCGEPEDSLIFQSDFETGDFSQFSSTSP